MLICMKPSDKEISDLQCRIERALAKENLSYADLAKITSVHASQVSRICSGDFKTFSNNVVQICKALKIRVPRIDEEDDVDIEWAKVHASLRRIWDQTPEGAARSEEHTSELQSLMRISYAVFCLKKKNQRSYDH